MRKPNFSGINSSRGAYVVPTSLNKQLVPDTPVAWDGTEVAGKVDVPLGDNLPVLIYVDNSDCDQVVTVTFNHLVAADKPVVWKDGEGNEVTFDVTAGAAGVFGPIQCFPRFTGGQIVLTAAEAPADEGSTIVGVLQI